MSVHPMRAGGVDREVVVVCPAALERWLRQSWHAILAVGRQKPVPVNQGWFAAIVFQANLEARAGIHGEPRLSSRLQQAQDLGRLAIDVDGPAVDPES